MQFLIEALDKFASLQEPREHKKANPVWFTKGPKIVSYKQNLAHKGCLRTG